MGSSRISADDVLRVASLAHLALGKDEVTAMAGQLEQVLGYMQQLNELDVTSVEPMAYVRRGGLPLRPDVEAPSLGREIALREAPSTDGEGFRVPAFVDEG